jgi:hypothetical protein
MIINVRFFSKASVSSSVVKGVLASMYPQDSVLVFTSLLFFLPFSLAVRSLRYDFAFAYGLLAVVSSNFHWTKNRLWLYLDYPLCYLITGLLAREAHRQTLFLLFVIGGSLVFILFWVGWMTKRFVFSPQKTEKLFAHVVMHLIVNSSACGLLLNAQKKF